jgi:hypothetical protein
MEVGCWVVDHPTTAQVDAARTNELVSIIPENRQSLNDARPPLFPCTFLILIAYGNENNLEEPPERDDLQFVVNAVSRQRVCLVL